MMIKECWKLTGREAFLAITWEPDFSQACCFCRVLMNHKNFHFTQIWDKTNNAIFLKSPKTLFFGHFWSFLPKRDLFQKIQLCHTQLYLGHLHHAKFQEKLMSYFQKTYSQTEGPVEVRQKDGQKVRQRPRPGVQKL